MSNPTCETCRWWDELPPDDMPSCDPDEALPRDGKCRRYPPRLLETAISDYEYGDGTNVFNPYNGVWPYTNCSDFCGEHQPKPEEKE